MTRLKNHPMDESADPTPRTDPAETKANRKKQANDKKQEKNALGKTDATAFDAKNNNMHRKR